MSTKASKRRPEQPRSGHHMTDGGTSRGESTHWNIPAEPLIRATMWMNRENTVLVTKPVTKECVL